MNNLKKLQALCGGDDFDALLLTGEVNRFYATGIRTSAGVVLLAAGRAVFMTDFRYIEAARERSDGFEVCMTTRDNDYESAARKLIAEWGVRRLGFEESVTTVESHNKWSGAIDVEWAPAQNAIAAQRAVKASWELERMRNALRIAERAYETVLGVLREGMTEREIAAELIYNMLKNGASDTSFAPIVVSGPNSSLPHGEPGGRAVRAGDFLTMDFGCVDGGYCSDITRTVAIGYADDEMRRVYGIVLDAQAAGIKAARAGVKGRVIHEAAARVIEDAGYGEYFGHGFGHGIGIEVHEAYSAHPKEERELPAGAVITAEPGIYLPGRFGVRIEDCVALRGDGCENLTSVSKELRVVG